MAFSTCEANRQTDRRPAEQATKHGADCTGVCDGPVDVKPEISSEHAENRENQIAGELMRQPDRGLHQRYSKSGVFDRR